MREVTPLFLFSVPRSGSTMVQRVLAAHPEVATSPEPWVLLPLLYALRREGIYAEYNHGYAAAALEDFCRDLPDGSGDYLAELRAFALRLYSKAAGGEARYFLDKTPRYHLVVEDIMRLFPEGKFVFLWRDPLAVVASVMRTWGRGRWNLHFREVDLFDGLSNLISAYEKHSDEAYAVRYEDLVRYPEEWRRLFGYLDLAFDPGVLSRFADVRLGGRMGDPTRAAGYQEISAEPLHKWKSTPANPIRKAWLRGYLRWLGRERLAVMHYGLDSLLSELDTIPNTSNMIAPDAARLGYQWLESKLLRDRVALPPSLLKAHTRL